MVVTALLTSHFSLMKKRDITHRAAFETFGETYVRVQAQQGGEIGAEANAWLAEQQQLRDADAAAKRDAREEKTLSIAEKALHSSKVAMCLSAFTAIIAAIIAAIFSK